MARLRLKDIFGGRADDSRAAEGETRRIELTGASIDYRLVRARRRSIGMHIDFSGLTVRAPRWVSRREIDETLAKRGAWILRSLDEWQACRRDVLPREWKTGDPILYRGRELALAVLAAPEREVAVDLLNLTVRHPAAPDEGKVATFVTRWLREEAARIVLPRVAEYAARITHVTPVVKLSNGRSEWGSCNHKGVIRLNWRLIQLPPDLALYVVAHEVAHLVELNHSARFWALVEGLFPGSAAARRTLDDWTALLAA